MISIVLLLKIVGAMCFAAGWAYLCLCIRRTAQRLERLRAFCEERLEAPAPELDEERRTALEAERRFTEGIASILNFSHMVPQDIGALKTGTGRKDDA